MQRVEISVNGTPREIPSGTTVAGLLVLMEIDRARVAVERNQDVVPRRAYDDTLLGSGDQVEIVGFVGGG